VQLIIRVTLVEQKMREGKSSHDMIDRKAVSPLISNQQFNAQLESNAM
jgi:hypothetical protein